MITLTVKQLEYLLTLVVSNDSYDLERALNKLLSSAREVEGLAL